jgi:hypothetical protein
MVTTHIVNNTGWPFLKYPAERNVSHAKRRFLWMANRAFVHRGLDLVLEAFAKMPELELNVAGPIESENDFVSAYYKELYETANIRVHGWISVASELFSQLSSDCLFFIYPTCSEGQSGSVITAMNRGMIPIITEDAGIDDQGQAVMLHDPTADMIISVCRKCASCDDEELINMAVRSYDIANSKHSRAEFTYNCNVAINEIINNDAIRRER